MTGTRRARFLTWPNVRAGSRRISRLELSKQTCIYPTEVHTLATQEHSVGHLVGFPFTKELAVLLIHVRWPALTSDTV